MKSMASWKVWLLTACLVSAAAWGQGAAGPGPRAPRPMSAPARMDLASARKALDSAEAAAVAAGVRVAIAVVDANGDLVAFVRNDGAPSMAVTTSQGKARAAILFGVRTKLVQDAMLSGRALSVRVTAPQGGAWELTPMQGGVPILRAGRLIGAVGVGGSPPPMDERIAQAGVDAVSAH